MAYCCHWAGMADSCPDSGTGADWPCYNKLCRQGLLPALKSLQILNFFLSSACSMELDAPSAQHFPPNLFLVRENSKPSIAFALGQVFGFLDTSALRTFSPVSFHEVVLNLPVLLSI